MIPISIVIPSYNRENQLHRALLSVKNQTRSCSELIVVDDGSTDSTCQLVQSFAANCDFPVIYVYQKKMGPAAARNHGIRVATFPVLAFLDSDDHWKKNKLEIQYAKMERHTDRLISHTQEQWLRCGIHLNQKKIHQPQNGDIFSHCLQLCAVGMSTVMVKKEFFNAVGLFNEALPCCEDYDLWLRSSHALPFLLVETPLTIKEGGRTDQVSYQYCVGMDRFRIFSILHLLQCEELSHENAMLSLLELQKKCLVYGNGCVKHKRIDEGKAYLQIAEWANGCHSKNTLEKDSIQLQRFLQTAENNIKKIKIKK